MLLKVGPNLDSVGEATIDLRYCVVDPSLSSDLHCASKSICSLLDNEGRASNLPCDWYHGHGCRNSGRNYQAVEEHRACKSISSWRHSEGKAGDHPADGCLGVWGSMCGDRFRMLDSAMAICPPPQGRISDLEQDGGRLGSDRVLICALKPPGRYDDRRLISGQFLRNVMQAIFPSPPGCWCDRG